MFGQIKANKGVFRPQISQKHPRLIKRVQHSKLFSFILSHFKTFVARKKIAQNGNFPSKTAILAKGHLSSPLWHSAKISKSFKTCILASKENILTKKIVLDDSLKVWEGFKNF